MNMKILLGIGATVLLLGTFGGYRLYSESVLQQEQLANYESYVQQLQTELEAAAAAEVTFETELNSLRRQLASSDSRIDSLQADLESARQRIDPDVAVLEQQIRERITLEVQQAQAQTTDRANLIKQLTALPPTELGMLMAVQGMYGEFIESLDIDDERRVELVDGLTSIMQEQNRRRRELFAEMQRNPDQIEQIQQEMMEINRPDALTDALSYVLNEAELQAYQEFREEQQQSGAFTSSTFSFSSGGVSNGVIFNSDGNVTIEDGGATGTTGAIRLVNPGATATGTAVQILTPGAPPN